MQLTKCAVYWCIPAGLELCEHSRQIIAVCVPRDMDTIIISCRDYIGATTLKQLFAVISAADLVICPDSGPAHMATAAGRRVIGLYSSSNPERTGPYNDMELTVNKYAEAVQKEFGKTVREVRFGQRVRNPQAMDLITVADVMNKVAIALENN